MIWPLEVRRRERGAAAAGFTLLELLVVIAILGFALVLVTGFRSPWSGERDLNATAASLAAQLRLVRSAAILDNRPAEFSLDLDSHRYTAGTAAEQRLPPGFSLQLVTIAGEWRMAGVGAIRFNPDGSSTGGRIVLGNGASRVAVGVDWLTGRVSIADLR